MRANILLKPAVMAMALLASSALAQNARVTTNPDGSLSGNVSVPGAPPVSVEAGNGQVTTSPDHGWTETPPPGGVVAPGSGKSVTVQSPNGAASAGAWTSGGGTTSVWGGGSPDAQVQYRSHGYEDGARPDHGRSSATHSYSRPQASATTTSGRRHTRHHHKRRSRP